MSAYKRVHHYSPESHLRVRLSPKGSKERTSFAGALKTTRQTGRKDDALAMSRRGKKVRQAFQTGNVVLKNLAMRNKSIRKYVEGS